MIHHETIKLGTTLWINQGGSHWRIGQLAEITKNQWGIKYTIALPNGTFDETSSIGGSEMKGIGWKIATCQEIDRYNGLVEKHGEDIVAYASGIVD